MGWSPLDSPWGFHPKPELQRYGSSSLLVGQLCLTLCDIMDYSLPGSSVHGISQTGILEWVAMPSSRGSSWPRYQTWVSSLWADSLMSEPLQFPQYYLGKQNKILHPNQAIFITHVIFLLKCKTHTEKCTDHSLITQFNELFHILVTNTQIGKRCE